MLLKDKILLLYLFKEKSIFAIPSDGGGGGVGGA